jgi:hypothetical protein
MNRVRTWKSIQEKHHGRNGISMGQRSPVDLVRDNDVRGGHLPDVMQARQRAQAPYHFAAVFEAASIPAVPACLDFHSTTL